MRELTSDEMFYVAGGSGPSGPGNSKKSGTHTGGTSVSRMSPGDTESRVNRAGKSDRVSRGMSFGQTIGHMFGHTDFSGTIGTSGGSVTASPHCGSCHGGSKASRTGGHN